MKHLTFALTIALFGCASPAPAGVDGGAPGDTGSALGDDGASLADAASGIDAAASGCTQAADFLDVSIGSAGAATLRPRSRSRAPPTRCS